MAFKASPRVPPHKATQCVEEIAVFLQHETQLLGFLVRMIDQMML